MTTYVAFSGGKDSTACALLLHEAGERFKLLFTPTGNELPELLAHVRSVAALVGAEVVCPNNRTLDFWIGEFGALPNHRQRWCTRLIKIEPAIAYLLGETSTLCIGLRHDEPERPGLYGDFLFFYCRYPLREARMGLADVHRFLKERNITIPRRTDCALCFGQRLSEWYALWRDHPGEWEKGERYEAATGRTFRSAQRDSWPAALRDLRELFEAGQIPRSVESAGDACRVCRL
jgi:PP-loop superfamily ATP-utilizing enzyme